MQKLILILAIISSINVVAAQGEPTVKGIAVVTSPTDKISGTVPVWNGTAWISGTNGSGSGGGDSIWTNAEGTIQASSTVVDGSSAVAFQMNSSNTLGNGNALLLKVQNNGTNVLTISGSGSVSGSYFYAGDTAGTRYSSYAPIYMDMFYGVQLLTLDPALLFGGSTPYIFNTYATKSSGNLFELFNNGTNKFSVTVDGGITTGLPAGATNSQPFKIGSEANASGLVLVATNYIQIEINGVAYKLGLVQ